jgi:hypothetical protein
MSDPARIVVNVTHHTPVLPENRDGNDDKPGRPTAGINQLDKPQFFSGTSRKESALGPDG